MNDTNKIQSTNPNNAITIDPLLVKKGGGRKKKKKVTTTATPPGKIQVQQKEPFGYWPNAAIIEPNNFKFKSLSCWALNTAIGCAHACRFCYVPDVSAKKQGQKLLEYGITDPDAQWGDYSLLRHWDKEKFLKSLKSAENIPLDKLNADGNRCVIYCSTTDPYQVFRGSTPEKQRLLNIAARHMVTKSLELIHSESTLNVRILTRSPLASTDFELYKRFGRRLLFGMSLPTLDDDLARIYEPKAPAPSQRLKTLQLAKEMGLHIYVAMAPTFPECDEADLRKTLTAIKDLDPITIFHEPINIRAENVERIATHAKSIGRVVNTAVFATGHTWRVYAINQLMLVQKIATELGIHDHLHLWPDKSLKSKPAFLSIRKSAFNKTYPQATKYEQQIAKTTDQKAYEEYLRWIEAWHTRISEWPQPRSASQMATTGSVECAAGAVSPSFNAQSGGKDNL